MIDARKPEANECTKPCLFYTAKLSGAAERAANYVLWDHLTTAATEERKYQTIWVCFHRTVLVVLRSLNLHRICMTTNTTQECPKRTRDS